VPSGKVEQSGKDPGVVDDVGSVGPVGVTVDSVGTEEVSEDELVVDVEVPVLPQLPSTSASHRSVVASNSKPTGHVIRSEFPFTQR